MSEGKKVSKKAMLKHLNDNITSCRQSYSADEPHWVENPHCPICRAIRRAINESKGDRR